jgi:hypothetical protein
MENNFDNPAGNPEATVREFEQNFLQPAKAAVDTPAAPPPTVPDGSVTTPDSGGAFRVFSKPEAAPVQEPAKPLFEEAIREQEKPKAKDVKGISLETFLQVRNLFQSELLAMIAKTGNPERYKLDEEQLTLLAEAYAPYADTITGTIPPWVMILMIEGVTTGKLVIAALEDRKAITRNAKAMRNGQVAETVRQAARVVPLNATGVRTRYDLHSDGTYQYTRDGAYRKVTEPGGERPDLTNIEEVKNIIRKNKWIKVQRILGLDDEWLQRNGIDLTKLD